MTDFVIGQAWVNHSDTRLGLGIVIAIEGRQVRIRFPAAAEERVYAMQNAPLTRIEHQPGEVIRSQDGKTIQITKLEPYEGRIRYHGLDSAANEHTLDERQLDGLIEFSSPKQRLTSGQFDNKRAFQLRCDTLLQTHRLQQSSVRGLLGSRTKLLAHQTYIAHEVAKRYAPRVLLADEVGLGKTIEAGMILHYQLHSGLATRVLIIVPPGLTHQWLVEMLRRFNLPFALFNAARLRALSEQEGNPFESEQLILCSLDDLTGDASVFKQVLAADWDMVIVDEAHHLQWSEDETGHDYRCIARLAERCRGLLLLTATPEQAGAASHFSRLRLLDPARFHDLEHFLKEEQGYKELNETVKRLLGSADRPVSVTMLKQLQSYLDDDAPTTLKLTVEERQAVISKLLDRNGTGRVFMRNTREAIKGFPKRKLYPYPLTQPAIYHAFAGKQTLYPEITVNHDDWLNDDPRIIWLTALLKRLNTEKILLICAHANTAKALEKHLQRLGIRSAAFYEALSIIERDRAAAYFAETDHGAQILICSEIGSEGRNFQFAHHLVLFDLPLNPDLLEQRIGRLDRIGQKNTIHIHAPYIAGTAQDVLFNWYDKGLNILTESCAAAYAIYEKFAVPLNAALEKPDLDISALLADTHAYMGDVKQRLQQGRDRLIELNSCRQDIAAELINTINAEEQPQLLMDYMEQMFDTYGVLHEEHSSDTWILHPSEHMRMAYFPGLRDDSLTVTFNRQKALAREDFSFISWEHPMVAESMDMLLSSEVGNSHITTIEKAGIEAGSILLETFSSIHAVAPKSLQLERYLPLSPLRTLLSHDRKDYSTILSHQAVNALSMKIDRETAIAISKKIKIDIEKMIDFAIKLTQANLPQIRERSQQGIDLLLNTEIERLQQLSKKNASIRQDEIEFLQTRYAACSQAISLATYELQAVRLVIVQ